MKKSNGRKSNARVVSQSQLAKRDVFSRLQALLFSPKLILPSVLAVGLAGGTAFGQSLIPFEPKDDITIDYNQILYVNFDRDLNQAANDRSKTITLNGGFLEFEADAGELILFGDAIEGFPADAASKKWEWGSAGGYIYIANRDSALQINKAHNNSDLTVFGDGDLYLSAAQGETHEFNELVVDVGRLYVSAVPTSTNWYGPSNSIVNGNLFVQRGGSAFFFGDATFNNVVYLLGDDDGSANVSFGVFDGTANFKKDVVASRAGLDCKLNTSSSVQLLNNSSALLYSSTFDYSDAANAYNYLYVDGNSNIGIGDADVSENRAVVNFIGGGKSCLNLFVNSSAILVNDTLNVSDTYAMFNESSLFTAVHEGKTPEINFNNAFVDLCASKFWIKESDSLSITDSTLYISGLSSSAEGHGTFMLLGDAQNIKFNGASSIYIGPYGNFLQNGQNYDYNGAPIMIDNAGSAVGYASGFNTAVGFVGTSSAGVQGLLRYSNLPPSYDPYQTSIDVIQNTIYYTEDEFKNKTYLEADNTAAMIADAISSGQVVTAPLVGAAGVGEVAIWTSGDYSAEEYEPGKVSSSNGYTVVFDSSQNADAFTGYGGKLTVMKGAAVLNGGTVFGSGEGVVQVYGEVYAKDAALSEKFNQTIYSAESFGTLAFNRSENDAASVAPTLRADVASFPSFVAATTEGIGQDVVKGARLWLNAQPTADASSTQPLNLGQIEANEVVFSPQTRVYYQGASQLSPEQQTTFALRNLDGSGGTRLSVLLTEDNKQVVQSLDADAAELFIAGDSDAQRENYATDEEYYAARNGLFGTGLLDAQYDAASGVVTVDARNIAEFDGLTDEEIRIASVMDQNRLQTNNAMRIEFYDSLYNDKNNDRVRQTISNVSKGSPISPQFSGHLGNPSSNFWGLGQTVEIAALAPGLGTLRTQAPDEDWTDEIDARQESSVFENQSQRVEYAAKSRLAKGVWATYAQTELQGDSYQEGVRRYDAFDVRRRGVLGGYRAQLDGTTTVGVLFAASTPEVWQNGDFASTAQTAPTARYFTKMEMTDFQFAGHLEKTFWDNWSLALFVGGGAQWFDWERETRIDANATLGNDAQRCRFLSDGDGNTLTATAYLARRFDVARAWTLSPTVGIDSEHSWLYEFTETQNGAYVVDPFIGAQGTFVDALTVSKYGKTQYSRNVARVGLTTSFTGPRQFVTFNGRAFYGTQIGGEDSMSVDVYKYADATGNWLPYELQGNKTGRDSFSLGGGGRAFLNKKRTISVSGDYNYMAYDYASTENVSAGFLVQF